MTPRTRSRNKDTDYKVYYSKKVPQQLYFPHRRKTVRRPSAATKHGSDKRQMRFLPHKMRISRDVADSDEEEDGEDDGTGGISIGLEAEDEEVEDGRSRKRRKVAEDTDVEADEEADGLAPKRRRTATAQRPNRRSKQLEQEVEDEDDSTAAKRQSVDRSRTLRRQSTMTQLVEGRRPLSDTEEPAFRPVKHSPRLSWSGRSRKSKDRRQRTLTQMVRDIRPVEIMSDDGMEDDEHDKEAEQRESQAYKEATLALLAQDNFGQDNNDTVGGGGVHGSRKDGEQMAEDDLPVDLVDAPSLAVHSVEDTDDEESYQPTQFINAPNERTSRAPRSSVMKRRQARISEGTSPSDERSRKSKFGLLSTPERRRIREIPSSQSPPDSPLSTQVSPSKADRAPLQERSGNPIVTAETPSERKQVTFSLPAAQRHQPPTSRKFRSTILDSEDEDDDVSETDEIDSGHAVGADTQVIIRNMDRNTLGRDVGNETQAILDQIDQACGHANEDSQGRSRHSSEEVGASIFDRAHESSPELGEPPVPRHLQDIELAAEMHSPYRTAHAGINQAPDYHSDVQDTAAQDLLVDGDAHTAYHPSHDSIKKEQHYEDEQEDVLDAASAENDAELPTTAQAPSSPPIVQPIEDTCPSTPLVIMDSSDEEDGPDSTPPPSSRTVSQPSKNTLRQSQIPATEAVQVPRSPVVQPESQLSHSSKAEQQLQNEWFSYSQYIKARPAQSSSMHVAHDKFSYDATPHPPLPTAPQHYMSQATTVDEVTPRKNRTQRTSSANTTPRRIANSQPLSSPVKPPPLIIPSSFPSPAKARMDEWSSPVYGRTQDTFGGGYGGASLEDFSIPLPPPVEDDDD